MVTRPQKQRDTDWNFNRLFWVPPYLLHLVRILLYLFVVMLPVWNKPTLQILFRQLGASLKFLPESLGLWLFSAGNNPHAKDIMGGGGKFCSPTIWKNRENGTTEDTFNFSIRI